MNLEGLVHVSGKVHMIKGWSYLLSSNMMDEV